VTSMMSNCRRWPVLLVAVLAACVSDSGPDGPLSNVARAADSQAPDGPRVFFTDVEAGPVIGGPKNLGVPIAIFGKGFGKARGTSRVTIGGVEVASYPVWGANNAHNNRLDMIVVEPGPKVNSGAIVVTVNGRPSNPDYSFKVNSRKVYYVATSGSDGNACSATAPCATILRAIPAMKPGDMVLVRGGTYLEGEIWIRIWDSGNLGQPKVIKNYPGEEVYLANNARDIIVDANHITVSGLNFQNGKALNVAGWAQVNETDDKFINNTFSGNINYAAIETQGSNHVIAGNSCNVSGSSQGTMGHCYYVAQGDNSKILYNVASGQPGYGLHIYEEQRATPDFQRVISNVLVEGNVLKNSTQRSGMVVATTDQGGYGNHIENVTIRNNIFTANNHSGLIVMGLSQGVKIYNNTFYQNGREAIYIENDPKVNGVDIRNNLIYQSTNGNCVNECSFFREGHLEIGAAARNVTLDTNSYHPGSPAIVGRKDSNPITGSVQFVNAAALDFHIQPGSAEIDRGLTLTSVPTDFDGRRRPQGAGYDTGAFEYVKPGIASLICNPFVILAPGSTFCTVGLTVQASADESLQLATLADASSLTLPSNVPVPAGSSSENVRVNATTRRGPHGSHDMGKAQ